MRPSTANGLQQADINYTHLTTNDDVIYNVAQKIWGVAREQLAPAKYNQLKQLMENYETRRFGKIEAIGLGDTIMLSRSPEPANVDGKSNRQCSLHTCQVTDAAFRCSQCHTALYCSRDHQRLDWKRHKINCL